MKSITRLLVVVRVFFIGVCFIPAAWAQDAANIANKAQIANGSPISTGGMIIQVLTALAMVTASIFVLAWLMKRLGGQSLLQQRGMKMLATMPVATREKIALIEVEGKRFLIGIASGNVNCLHVFEEEPTLNEGEVESSNDVSQSQTNPVVSKPQSLLKTEKWDFASAFKQLIKDGERK